MKYIKYATTFPNFSLFSNASACHKFIGTNKRRMKSVWSDGILFDDCSMDWGLNGTGLKPWDCITAKNYHLGAFILSGIGRTWTPICSFLDWTPWDITTNFLKFYFVWHRETMEFFNGSIIDSPRFCFIDPLYYQPVCDFMSACFIALVLYRIREGFCRTRIH